MSTLVLPTNQEFKKTLYFKKGENPFMIIDTIKYFYFIISGKMKIFDINFENEKEQILYLLTSGDMFDIKGLLNQQEVKYSGEVLEDLEVIQIPSENVHKMILENERFRNYFYSYVSKQLEHTEDLLVDISLYDVYTRMLKLFYNFGKNLSVGKPLSLLKDLTQDDLASMIGTVRRVFNRNLQKMKKNNLIEIKRKEIFIKNLKKLENEMEKF